MIILYYFFFKKQNRNCFYINNIFNRYTVIFKNINYFLTCFGFSSLLDSNNKCTVFYPLDNKKYYNNNNLKRFIYDYYKNMNFNDVSEKISNNIKIKIKLKYDKIKKNIILKYNGVKNVVIENYELPENFFPCVKLKAENESFKIYKIKK
jgi:hypothetical protein